MRATPVRLILLAAPLLVLIPLALAGCYTVLSHPSSGSSDPGTSLALDAPHDALAGQDCMSCHVGHGGQDLDVIGRTWNQLDQRYGLDPNWPSAYANWLGYLPDSWLDYYRDPYWRDPWVRDPWLPGDGPAIVISEGSSVEPGPPPETGSRHLWGRPEPYSGPVPTQTSVPSGNQGSSSPQQEPIQGEVNQPTTRQPDRQQSTPPPPSEPSETEKGGRHLWGRPRR